MTNKNHSSVSVIIPCLNEFHFIGRCVQSLIDQDYPTDLIEIIISDGLSDDGSRDIISTLSNINKNHKIILLDNFSRRTPNAMNLGINKAKGDIIIFLCAHSHVDKNYIRLNVEYLENRNLDCVGGRQINIGESYIQSAIGAAMSSMFGIASAPHRFESQECYLDSANFPSYRREVIKAVGYFDEDRYIAEDAEYDFRVKKAGYRMYYAPEIVIYFYPRSTLTLNFRKFYRDGAYRVNLLKKHIDAFNILHWIPMAFISSLIITLIAGISVDKHMLYAHILIWSAYLAFALTGAVYISINEKKNYVLIIPPVLFTMHAGFGAGWLRGIFKTKR